MKRGFRFELLQKKKKPKTRLIITQMEAPAGITVTQGA